MQTDAVIDRLEGFLPVLPALLADLPQADATWTPPGGGWSIQAIVRHLADEEVEDFRTRVRLTLEDPTRSWPPIDPEGAARERGYDDGTLTEAIDRFTTARRASIVWLRTLEGPDWDRAREHSTAGPLRAGDLMVSWCAHDALHLRQLAKRLFQLTRRDGAPYETRYAGDWTA